MQKVIKETPRAMILTILGVTLSIFLSTIFAYSVLGWDFLTSLLLGIVLSGVSSSVVIPLINKIEVSDAIKTMLTLESAFTDAIVVVLGLALLQFMTTAQGEIYTVARDVMGAFSIAIVMGIFVGIIWLKVLKYIRGEKYDDILTLAIVFLFYAVTEGLGGNGAIFALFFGLVLGNGIYFSRLVKMKQSIQADGIMKKFHSEISFLISTFFFVYLGLILLIESYIIFLFSVILSLIFLFGRYLATYIISWERPLLKKSMNVITIMLPRGLSAAVMSELIVLSGIPNAGLFPQIVIVVIISTVVIAGIGTSLLKRKFKLLPSKKEVEKAQNLT
jgi:cell volume regulation protein A